MRFILTRALALTLAWGVSQASGAEPPRAQVAAAAAVAPAPGMAALLVQVREIDRLGQQIAAAQVALRQAEAEAGREAREIDELKEQAQSVTRDLALQDRLARAQERAARLSQGAAALRGLRARRDGLRRQLLSACDRVLADSALLSMQRLEVLRLRAAQAEALSSTAPAGPELGQLGALAASAEQQPDDPVLLRERADLLRDSADKVRRELQRLSERTTELQRRQRLRERAAAVDEDLFAEQASSRRGAGNNETSLAAGANAPPQDRANGAPESGGPMAGVSTTPPAAPVLPATRSGLDPATLDLLRRGEASADPDVKLRALRRAQAELQRLMDQLGRRANQLDQRAVDLSRRK